MSFKPPFMKTKAKWWFAAVIGVTVMPIVWVVTSFELGGVRTVLFVAIAGVVIGPVGALILLLIARLRPQDFVNRCQVCDLALLPRIRLPRSWHEGFWGGWTCKGCGSELDRHGNLRTSQS